MKATINNTLIPKLLPGPKPYDVRDEKLIGFLIRVNLSGKLLYMCEYARGKRITIGKVGVLTPTQARDKALTILCDAAKGLDPTNKKKPKKKLTLEAFINQEYAPWVIQHRKSGILTVSHIKRCFFKLFGDKPLNEISPALIDQWRTQKLKEGKSTETVNRYIANFKAALSKAVLWDFVEHHPLEKLKLLKTDRTGKIRFLSVDEEQRLRQVTLNRDERIKLERTNGNQWRQERNYELMQDLNNQRFADHIHPMLLLSINTGIRQGELFSLKWENIHFDQAMLTIEGINAKSGKTRHIPLNIEALNTLKDWRKQSSGTELVFPNKSGEEFNNIKKAWSAILTAANINNFRWHDLRHHFASRLVMCGVDLNTVRELLGHSDMAMTLRYAHLAPEHKANAVAKLVNNDLRNSIIQENAN